MTREEILAALNVKDIVLREDFDKLLDAFMLVQKEVEPERLKEIIEEVFNGRKDKV